MKLKRLHSLIITLFIGLIIATPMARADFVWGVNGHPLNAYSGITVEQQLDYVKDLGLKSYRVNVTDLGQTQALRHVVDEAKLRGFTILPVITPNFDLSAETTEALQKRAYDLAFNLVSAFKGEISVWELGNEMENFAIIKACERRDDGSTYNCSFGPAGGKSRLDYYGPRWAKVSAVLKGLSAGSLAADPNIRRAIGTAGWGHTGAFERLNDDGIPFEISIWHQYGLDPEWALQILATYKRPIWITEFNHPLGSQKSSNKQAAGLSTLIARLLQLRKAYNVEAAFVYQLMDEAYWAPDFEAYMGLVEMVRDGESAWTVGSKKPAYEVYKAAVARDAAHLTTADAVDLLPNRIGYSLSNPLIARSCPLDGPEEKQQVTAQHVIDYAYCLTLMREPDENGRRAWTDRLHNGTTIATFLIELMHSDEFTQKHDLANASNAEYVTVANRLLLDRELDDIHRNAAISDIEKTPMSRADYLRRILASPDFQQLHPIMFRTLNTPPQIAIPRPVVRKSCTLKPLKGAADRNDKIEYSYCLVLGRPADPVGLKNWQEALDKGLTIAGLVQSLLSSAEFETKYSTARFDNIDFVTLMYRLLLSRDANEPERDSYVAQLDVGKLTRSDVMKSFINSDEFHTKQSVLFIAASGDGQHTGNSQ